MSLNDYTINSNILNIFEKHNIKTLDIKFVRNKISRYKRVQSSQYQFYDQYILAMKSMLTDEKTVTALENNNYVRMFKYNDVKYYRTYDSLFVQDGDFFDVVRFGSRYSGMDTTGKVVENFKFHENRTPPSAEFYVSEFGFPIGDESNMKIVKSKFGHFIDHEGDRCNLCYDEKEATGKIKIIVNKFDLFNAYVIRESHNFKDTLLNKIARCHIVCYSPDQVVVKNGSSYEVYDMEGNKMKLHQIKIGTFKLVAVHLWQNFKNHIKDIYHVIRNFFTLIIEKITRKKPDDVINGTDIDAVKILIANHYVLSSFLLLCIVTFFFPLLKFVIKKFCQLIINGTKKVSESVTRKIEEIALYGVKPKKILCTFCSTVTWIRKGKFLCDPSVDITKIISPGLFILTCLFVQVEPFRVDGTNAIATIPIKNGYCSTLENINGTMEICLDSARHYYSKTESYKTGIYNIYYSKNRECKKNGEGTCSNGCIDPFAVIGNINYSRSYCDYKTQPVSKCFFQYSCDYYSCGFQPVDLYDVYVCDYIEDEYVLRINGATYQYVAQDNVELTYGQVHIMLSQSISNIDRVIHVFNDSFTSPRISYAMSPSFGQIGQIQTISGRTIWNDEVITCSFDNVYVNDVDVFDNLSSNVFCDDYTCYTNITSKETILFTITMPLDQAFIMDTSPIKGNITEVDCFNTMQSYVRCNIFINGSSNNFIVNITEPYEQDHICSSPCEITIDNVSETFILCIESQNEFCGVVDVTSLRYNSTINGSPIYQKVKQAFATWKIILITIASVITVLIVIFVTCIIIKKVIIPLLKFIFPLILMSKKAKKINGIKIIDYNAKIHRSSDTKDKDIDKCNILHKIDHDTPVNSSTNHNSHPRSKTVSIYDSNYRGLKEINMVNHKFWTIIEHNGLFIYSPNTKYHCLFACQLLRELYLKSRIFIHPTVHVFSELTIGEICEYGEGHVVFVSDKKIEDTNFFIKSILIRLHECQNKRIFALDFQGQIDYQAEDSDMSFQNRIFFDYKSYLNWCVHESRIPLVEEMFMIISSLSLPIFNILSPQKIMTVKEHLLLAKLAEQGFVDDQSIDNITCEIDNIKITLMQWYIFVCADFRARISILPYIFSINGGKHEIPNITMNEYPLSINTYISRPLCNFPKALDLLISYFIEKCPHDLDSLIALEQWVWDNNEWLIDFAYYQGLECVRRGCRELTKFAEHFIKNATLKIPDKKLVAGYCLEDAFDFEKFSAHQPIINIDSTIDEDQFFISTHFTPVVIACGLICSYDKKCNITPSEMKRRAEIYSTLRSTDRWKSTTIYDNNYHGTNNIIREIKHGDGYIYTSQLKTLCYLFSCLLKRYNDNKDFHFEKYKISDKLIIGNVCKWSDNHVCYYSKHKMDFSFLDAKWYDIEYSGTCQNPVWLMNQSENIKFSFNVENDEKDEKDFESYKGYINFCMENYMKPVSEDFYLLLRFINFPFFSKLSNCINFDIREVVALNYCYSEDNINNKRYNEIKTKLKHKKVSKLQNLLCSMLPIKDRFRCWPVILSQSIKGEEYLINISVKEFPRGCEKFIETITDIEKLIKLVNMDINDKHKNDEKFLQEFRKDYGVNYEEIGKMVSCKNRQKDIYYDRNRKIGKMPKRITEFYITYDTCNLMSYPMCSYSTNDEKLTSDATKCEKELDINSLISDGKILDIPIKLNDHVYHTKDIKQFALSGTNNWQFIHQSVRLCPLIKFIKFNSDKVPMLKPTSNKNVIITHDSFNIFSLQTLVNLFSKVPRDKIIKVLEIIANRNIEEIDKIVEKYHLSRTICFHVNKLLDLNVTWSDPHKIYQIDEDIILTYYDVLTQTYQGGGLFDQWYNKMLQEFSHLNDSFQKCERLEDILLTFMNNVTLIKPAKYIIASLMSHCYCLLDPISYLKLFHDIAAIIEWNDIEVEQTFVKAALMGHEQLDSDIIIQHCYSKEVNDQNQRSNDLVGTCSLKVDKDIFMEEMKHWLNKTSVDSHRICYSLLKPDIKKFYHRCTSGMCLFSSLLLPERWHQYEKALKDFEKKHKNDEMWTNQSIYSVYSYFQEVNYGAILYYNDTSFVINPTAKIFIQMYHTTGHMMACDEMLYDPKLSMICHNNFHSIDKFDMITNYNADVTDFPPETLIQNVYVPDVTQFTVAKADDRNIPVDNYLCRPENPNKLLKMDTGEIFETHLMPGQNENFASHCLCFISGHSTSFFPFYPSINYIKDKSGYFNIFGQLYFGYLRKSNFNDNVLNAHSNSFMTECESCSINLLAERGIKTIGIINPVHPDMFFPMDEPSGQIGTYDINQNLQDIVKFFEFTENDYPTEISKSIKIGNSLIQPQKTHASPQYCNTINEIIVISCRPDNPRKIEDVVIKIEAKHIMEKKHIVTLKEDKDTDSFLLWNPEVQTHTGNWWLDNDNKNNNKFTVYTEDDSTSMKFMPHFTYHIKESYDYKDCLIDFDFKIRRETNLDNKNQRQPTIKNDPVYSASESESEDSTASQKKEQFISVGSETSSSSAHTDHSKKIELCDKSLKPLYDYIIENKQGDIMTNIQKVLQIEMKIEGLNCQSDKLLSDHQHVSYSHKQYNSQMFLEWLEMYKSDIETTQLILKNCGKEMDTILRSIYSKKFCDILNFITIKFDIFSFNPIGPFWFDTPLVNSNMILLVMKQLFGYQNSIDNMSQEYMPYADTIRYLIHFAQMKSFYLCPVLNTLINVTTIIQSTDEAVIQALSDFISFVENSKLSNFSLQVEMKKIDYMEVIDVNIQTAKPFDTLPLFNYYSETKAKVSTANFARDRRPGDEPPRDIEELLRAGSSTRQSTMEEIFKEDNQNKSSYTDNFRFDVTSDRLKLMQNILNSYCIERPNCNFTDIYEHKLDDDCDYLYLLEQLLSEGYAVSKLFGLTFYNAKESRITKYAIIGPKTLLLCKCNCSYKFYTTYIKDLNQQDVFCCNSTTLNNQTLGDFEVSSRRFTNKFYHYNNKIYYTVINGSMYITNHHDVQPESDYYCLLNGYEFSKDYIAQTSLEDGNYCYDGLEFYQNVSGQMRVSSVGRILGYNNISHIVKVDDSFRNTNKPLCGRSYFPYYNTLTNDELTTLIQSTGKDLENNSGFENGVYYNKNRIIFIGMLPNSNKRSSVKSYVCSKASGGFCFFTSGESQHGTVKVINRFHQHKIDLEIAQKNFGGLIVDVTDGTTLRYCEMFCNVWSLNTPEGKYGATLNVENITDDADAYIFGDCCYYPEIRKFYNNPKCYQISTYYEITQQITPEYQVIIDNDNMINVQLDGEGSPWKCKITDMVSILNNTKMIKKFTLNNITLFCGQYNKYCHVEHNVLFTSKQQNEIMIASNIKNASSKTTFLLTRTSLDPSTIPLAQSLILKSAWDSAQFYDTIELTGYAKAIEKFIPGLHRVLVALQIKPGTEPDSMLEEIVHLILKFNVDKLLQSIEDIVKGIIDIYTGKTESSNKFFKRLSENSIVSEGNIYFDCATQTWKSFTQSEIMEALHTYELENKVLTWKINGEYSIKDKIKILWYMLCNDHNNITTVYKVVKTWVLFIIGKKQVMSNIQVDENIRYTQFIDKTEEQKDTIVSAISQEISSIPIVGPAILKKTGLSNNVNKNCLVSISDVNKDLLIIICDKDTNEVVHYIIVDKPGPFKLMNKFDDVLATKTKVANSKSKFSDCLRDWKYINSFERAEIINKYKVCVEELNHQFDELSCIASNSKYYVNGKIMYREYYKGIWLTWPFGKGTKPFNPSKHSVSDNTTAFTKESIKRQFFEICKASTLNKGSDGITNIVYESTVCEYDCHVNDTATYIFHPTMSGATVPFTSASTVSEVCKYRFNTGHYKDEAVLKFAEFMKPILEDTINAGIIFAQESKITISDYLNHLQGDKKQEALAAYEHFNNALEVNKKFHLILKNDEMVIADPEKHARVIAAPERTHKLIIGYCAYIIEQFMIQHLKGFMIGKTGEEIRDAILLDYREGDNFVSLDTKAFDGSQHLPLQKTIDNELSKIAYLHVLNEFGPEGTDVLTNLTNIGEIWDTFVKVTCGFNVKAKYDLSGCVPSGHALHTTVANTYRAIYYQKYLLNDPDARVNAAGDDTLLILSDYELQKWKDNMHLVYSPDTLGQTLKELIISKEYFTFCSMKFTLHNSVMKDLTNYVGRYMTFSNENPICNFIQKTAAIIDWHQSDDFEQLVKQFSNFDEVLSDILKQKKEFLYLLERDKLLSTKELYYTPVSRGCQQVDISDLYSFFPDVMQYISMTQINYDYDHHRPVTRFEFMTNNWYNQILPNQILGDFIMPYDLDKLEQKICHVFEQLIMTDCEFILEKYFRERSLKQLKY